MFEKCLISKGDVTVNSVKSKSLGNGIWCVDINTEQPYVEYVHYSGKGFVGVILNKSDVNNEKDTTVRFEIPDNKWIRRCTSSEKYTIRIIYYVSFFVEMNNVEIVYE